MVGALSACGIPIGAESLDVQTQVPVDGVGTLDLFLKPASGRPVAIEVKVHSGESGDQLRRYREWTVKQAPEQRPWLVTLCRTRLSEHADVTWLPWQHLRRHALAQPKPGYWRDLADLLVECNMADDGDEPVTVTEAKVISDAYQLLKKTALILVEPAMEANRLWPGSNWPTGEKEIRKVVARRFATWPTYTIASQGRSRAGISMGLYHEPETQDAWLGIWVSIAPRRVQERARIDAQTSQLQGEPWFREHGTWTPVGGYAPLANVADHAEASRWFMSRLADVAQVGLFDLIPKLGSPGIGDEEVDESVG
jgi:hypothetical protein